MKIHISANDIEQWANNNPRRAQEQLPLLIWKLVLASCKSIRNHHFPFNKGVQYSGFDGYLDADSSSLFVPDGKSIWEFGTNKDVKPKFESDYLHRTQQIRQEERLEYTFCFVTSRIWNARRSVGEIIEEKEKNDGWKNVRIFDASDLEMWIEQYPAISIWFSTILEKTSGSVVPLREYWREITEDTTPSLNPQFFIEGRKSILQDFKRKLSERKKLILKAESPLEAVLVLASEMISAGENEEALLDRCVIVNDLLQLEGEKSDWENVIAILNPMGYIAKQNSFPVACTVVIPVCEFDPLDKISESNEKIEIEKRSRRSFCAGLEKLGYSNEEADQITSETWMSVTAFYRKISKSPINRLPAWTNNSSNEILIPALLVGQWESIYDGDKCVIEMLSGIHYQEYIDKIDNFIRSNDAPIKNIAEVYACVTPSDMWALLWRSITKQNIIDFLSALKTIFAMPDNKYDLPHDKWYCAQLYGKKPYYSNRLRNSMLYSAFILSKMGKADRDSILPDIPERCSLVVKQILNNISSEQMLFSVIPFFPKMFEVCPDVILTYIEQELDKKDSYIWCTFVPEQNMLFEQGMYWHIRWTLERALWIHKFASRALKSIILIVESDIDKKVKDYFKETFISVFRLWYPQSSLTKDERKQMIILITNTYPKTGEYLFSNLLRINGDTATPISFPQWCVEKRKEPHVSQDEINEMYMFVCQEFLSNLRPELAQWKIVLKHLPIMLEMEHKLFEICRAHAKEMAEDDVIQFCSAIAKHIYHCRKFPNASKGESPEIVAQLETLYNEILPNCPKAFLHNFDWQYEGLNPIPFQEIKYVREQEEACELEDCKKQMARMISINGKDAFLTIASKTENQKKFAQVFISMYMNNVFDWKAVERVRVQSESCARRVVQELSYEGLFSVNPSQIEQLEPMDAIWILSCFDITEKNIVILESYPDEVQKKYWEMVNCSWMDYNDIKMVRHILPRIAEAKRCYQILNHFG